MRYMLLASALMVVAPAAFAQTSTSKPAMSAPAAQAPAGYTVQPANPNNCGTPDEPKPCGGTMAHAMPHKMTPAAKKPST